MPTITQPIRLADLPGKAHRAVDSLRRRNEELARPSASDLVEEAYPGGHAALGFEGIRSAHGQDSIIVAVGNHYVTILAIAPHPG